MSLTGFFPGLVHTMRTLTSKISQPVCSFHSLTKESPSQINPGGLFSIPMRTVIRVHFPRPNERKRIKRHGFRARMSTPEGRRVIMNRILKGRFVYTH
ncbi:hypothetical protein NQ318_016541 [Aromia moschata]|uniref:Large ribosomal subunit protein bL34m n=1 Tax=Aromia moschata TaxID=1265417 RepID=A0AAV8YYD9_9CUCU|nr:hypothetical protein NQ318_016541 [Aromia moschata]